MTKSFNIGSPTITSRIKDVSLSVRDMGEEWDHLLMPLVKSDCCYGLVEFLALEESSYRFSCVVELFRGLMKFYYDINESSEC